MVYTNSVILEDLHLRAGFDMQSLVANTLVLAVLLCPANCGTSCCATEAVALRSAPADCSHCCCCPGESTSEEAPFEAPHDERCVHDCICHGALAAKVALEGEITAPAILYVAASAAALSSPCEAVPSESPPILYGRLLLAQFSLLRC